MYVGTSVNSSESFVLCTMKPGPVFLKQRVPKLQSETKI
jgi:hypothetical protein